MSQETVQKIYINITFTIVVSKHPISRTLALKPLTFDLRDSSLNNQAIAVALGYPNNMCQVTYDNSYPFLIFWGMPLEGGEDSYGNTS